LAISYQVLFRLRINDLLILLQLVQNINYVVKTLFGLEEILAEEIRLQGGEQIEIQNRAVSVRGDLALGYRINYHCRTALSVLIPLHQGRVKDEQGLYDLVREVKWDDIFDVDKTFVVNVVCYSDLFVNSHFLVYKTKDAIVDQFRDRYGRRPSIDKEGDVKVNIFIKGDHCIISLNTSGASLFKRGYRTHTGNAPINEVLAAGLLYLSGWDRKVPLVDPMCGSGTIVLEAAMMAQGIPPQVGREDFAFMHLNNYEPEIWNEVRELPSEVEPQFPKITGRDHNRHYINLAKENGDNAGMKHILWECGDFFSWVPQSEPGILLFNPPYNVRIPLDDSIEFYKQIGDTFKKSFPGWTAWIISSNIPAVKRVGLKPSRKIPLFNGALECRFVKFEMYKGTKDPVAK